MVEASLARPGRCTAGSWALIASANAREANSESAVGRVEATVDEDRDLPGVGMPLVLPGVEPGAGIPETLPLAGVVISGVVTQTGTRLHNSGSHVTHLYSMHQTPWTHSRAQQKNKGKHKEQPKSPKVQKLEALLNVLQSSQGTNEDPKGGCFCQGTS
jgi:hypothetical protein